VEIPCEAGTRAEEDEELRNKKNYYLQATHTSFYHLNGKIRETSG
jgi:hypothetical protein